MNVLEFIEFLKTQDPAAIVQVLHSSNGRSCGEPYTAVSSTDFDPLLHVEMTDLTNSVYGKKYLLFGLQDSY